MAWLYLVTALPAAVGSALVLIVLFGWAGQWEGVLLAVWLAVGLVLWTVPGERIALRMHGFRRPTERQWQWLAPSVRAALEMSSTRSDDNDWYVLRAVSSNAFAVGRRGVAVTTGLLGGISAERVTSQMLAAVLLHELGHHAGSATRHTMVVGWLTAPWRIWSSVVRGLGIGLAGRGLPSELLALGGGAEVLIAVVQSLQRGDWVTAAALFVIVVCLIGAPLFDAAVSRRGESAADGFAAAVGLGPELASALFTLSASGGGRSRLMHRLLARHPDPAERIVALLTTAPTFVDQSCCRRLGSV